MSKRSHSTQHDATLWDDDSDIERLAELVRYHNRKHFIEHKNEISDTEFDRLSERLRELDPNNAALSELMEDTAPNESASELTESKKSTDRKKIIHDVPMLSIDKVFTADKVTYWAIKAGAFSDRESNDGLTASFKVDGISCSLVYQDGELIQASTRGNGKKGDDITANAKVIDDIPHGVAGLKGSRVEVRGEIYMSQPAFDAAVDRFERQLASGDAKPEDRPENPRNFAAGSIKQKDPEVTRERNLSFMAHTCVAPLPGSNEKSDVSNFERLAELGFKTSFFAHVKRTEDISRIISAIDERRTKLDYPCDGVVFTINRLALHAELGSTPHHTRFKLAYKFARDQGETTVEDIVWETSRHGRVCPTIKVKSITLGGANVTSCTAHNASTVRAIGLKIGDRVLLEREVVPYLVRKVSDPAELPKTCKSCQFPLEWDAMEKDLLCPNLGGCRAQLLDYLSYYASRRVTNIVGLGEKIIEVLVNDDHLKTPADIFRLTQEQIVRSLKSERERQQPEQALKRAAKRAAKGLSEPKPRPKKMKDDPVKKAQNLIEAINAAREQSLESFLFSLGIKRLGQTIAAGLAEHFGTLNEVLSASLEDLKQVERMPEPTARSIHDGLIERRALIDDLLRAVKLKQAEKVAGPLSGSSFCLTGHVEFDYGGTHYDARPEIEGLIKSKGGTIKSVSKALNYLVVGIDPGSKVEKAQKAGVKILDAAALVVMLG